MEKYGFIYVWYNRWKKKFYVGCHWGSENDGYISSSKLMREAYKRNPEYFKRRIVQRHYGTRQELLEIEHRWLQLIPDAELGVKYYNLSKKHFGHWTAGDNVLTIGQKISLAKKGKPRRPFSDETKAKISASKKGKQPSQKTIAASILAKTGKKASLETRAKMSASAANKGKPLSAETKAKISEAKRRVNLC